MSDNKVKYGLRNVHCALVTESGETVEYGSPKAIPGAVNLTLDASGEEVAFYADDQIYFEENTNNGYEGSLEIALIPDWFRKEILGDEEDANGALIENRDAKVKKMALLFEFDGDAKKTRHVMYSVLPTRPSVTGATRTATKEPQTETINIAARPALDTGDVKAKVLQSDADTYTRFYEAVYIRDMPTNSINQEPGEYSLAAPDDVEIEVASTDNTNKVTNVLLDGVKVQGIHLTVIGFAITINKAAFDSISAGAHVITVYLLRGLSVNVPLTVITGV